MQGREVVIVEAVRTPVGRGHPEKGQYRDVHPNALLGTVFTEVIARAGIEAEVVDLRSLVPLDMQTVAESVARTHRAVVVTEDVRTCSFGARSAENENGRASHAECPARMPMPPL